MRDFLGKHSRWLVAFLIGALAFAITVQWRQSEETEDFSGVRGAELVELLKSLDATNTRLNEQIETLTATRDELQNSTENSVEATDAAKRRADELEILAGTVGAQGEGIEITVTAPAGNEKPTAVFDAGTW